MPSMKGSANCASACSKLDTVPVPKPKVRAVKDSPAVTATNTAAQKTVTGQPVLYANDEVSWKGEDPKVNRPRPRN